MGFAAPTAVPKLGDGVRAPLAERLEALAALCVQAAPKRAVKLIASTQHTRDQIGYRFRFPNHAATIAAALDALNCDTEEPLSLADAATFANRSYGARKRPQLGWASLTPTELEVARLVAEGANNPAIGRTLSMSVNTVKTHLSDIFTKLNLTSRAQLAAAAAQATDL